MNIRYRPEIDGLRALAVVPVMFFHGGSGLLSGGYVGVDIFFVISGYLITSILLTKMEEGAYSISEFYERRARRILPALFVVILFCIVVAWMLFLPIDFKFFAQSVAASALFSANFFFLLKGGDYFSAPAEQFPLLHLWSLAVEEQFYIIFPLVLSIAWRIGGLSPFVTIGVLFAASLGLSEWGAHKYPVASYYLLPTRAWELLLGSLVAMYLNKGSSRSSSVVSQLASMVGLSLILLTLMIFDEETPFPGLFALVPTIGTALIIIYATNGTFVHRILSLRPLVWVGLISYALYLWHQPLFAFTRYYEDGSTSDVQLAALFVATFVLSALTYRFVERPFRDRRTFKRSTIFSLALIFVALLSGFGVWAHLNGGFPQRSEIFARLAPNVGLSLQCNGNTEINPVCSTNEHPQVAIFGNSIAMHLVPGFQTSFPQTHFVQLTQDSCQLRRNDKYARLGYATCGDFVRDAVQAIVKNPDIKLVIISSDFREMNVQSNLESFIETLNDIQSAGKEILILGPPPKVKGDIVRCYLRNMSRLTRCDFPRSDVASSHFENVARLVEIAQGEHITFVDLTPFICTQDICYAAQDDTLLYRDRLHLSIEGSRRVFSQIRDDIAQLVEP